jgi:hypothetical protein
VGFGASPFTASGSKVFFFSLKPMLSVFNFTIPGSVLHPDGPGQQKAALKSCLHTYHGCLNTGTITAHLLCVTDF